jgi:hypothetical protein
MKEVLANPGATRTTSACTTPKQRLLSEQVEEVVQVEEVEEVRWLWPSRLAERQPAWEERQETVDTLPRRPHCLV